jgi:hypothetical protein
MFIVDIYIYIYIYIYIFLDMYDKVLELVACSLCACTCAWLLSLDRHNLMKCLMYKTTKWFVCLFLKVSNLVVIT